MSFSVLPRPHPVDVQLAQAQKSAGQRFHAKIQSITPARPPKPSPPPPPPPVDHLAHYRSTQADQRSRQADEHTAMMQSRISTRVLLNQAAAAAAAGTQSTSTPTATTATSGQAYSFLQNSPQHALTQQLREASVSGSTAQAAPSPSSLPMQLQLSPHIARPPPAEVSQLQFESWEAQTALSRELDEEAIHLFLQIESACVHLTRDLQIRVERWVLKLSSLLTTTLSIQRDRDLYLRLLLDQVQKRALAFPFDRAPDERVALARLPLYMNLAKPTQTRNKSWHQVMHNLSATFLQSCAARARGAPAGTTGGPAPPAAEGSNALGGPLQQSREAWIKHFHTDHRSPVRPTRRGADYTPVDRLDSNPDYGAANPYAPWNSPALVGAAPASAAARAQLSPQPNQQPGAPAAVAPAAHSASSTSGNAEPQLEMTHSFSPAVHPHRAVSFDASSSSAQAARPVNANAAGFVGDVVFANMEREAALARQQAQQLAQQHGGDPSQHQAQASAQTAVAGTAGSEASFRPFASENETLRSQRDAARTERDELRALLGESEYLVSNLLVERDALKKQCGLLTAQLAAAREEPDFESMVREMHALRRARDRAEETLLQREAQLADLKSAAAEREQLALSQLLQQRKGGDSAAAASAYDRPYAPSSTRSNSSLFASPSSSGVDATMRRAQAEGSAYSDRRSYDPASSPSYARAGSSLDSTKLAAGSPDSYPISYPSQPASAARDRADRSAFSPPVPRASPPQRHTHAREPSSFDMLMAEQARLTGAAAARPARPAAWYPSDADLHNVMDSENPSSSFRAADGPDGTPVSPLRIDVHDPRSSDLEEEITLEGTPQPVAHPSASSSALAASTSPAGGHHSRSRSASRIPVLRSPSTQPQSQQPHAHHAHSTWAASDAAAALEAAQQPQQQQVSPSRHRRLVSTSSPSPSSLSSSSPSRRSATNPVGENGHHIAGIAAVSSPSGSRPRSAGSQKRVTPDGEIVVSPAARAVPTPAEDQEVFAQYARHFQRETQAMLSASRNGRKPRESRELTEAHQREQYGQRRAHDEEGAPDTSELHTHI